MNKQVHLKNVKGQLRAPASKSVAQRAIAIATRAQGQSILEYPGNADDVKAAINVARKLGAIIEEDSSRLTIRGGAISCGTMLDCGESGLGMRMFSALAASLSEKITLTGHGSLAIRPMNMIEESLLAAGVQCHTRNGLLPVEVQGPFPGGKVSIDGSVSSQVLTGLLIAAPYALNPSEFLVKDLKSRPYVDITVNMMKDFGGDVENIDYEVFRVNAPKPYQARNYRIEGDWSGAAFLMVAAAIGGEIMIDNLSFDSLQADKAILKALTLSGAFFVREHDRVFVKKSPLRGFDFDATHCPDLFPPLAVLAAACEGETTIKGVSRLKVKESDRAKTLQQELGKMGLEVRLDGDTMAITGKPLKGAKVHSHFDHRIAMACAVASLLADEPLWIEEAQAVNKSYPDFFTDMEKVNGNI